MIWTTPCERHLAGAVAARGDEVRAEREGVGAVGEPRHGAGGGPADAVEEDDLAAALLDRGGVDRRVGEDAGGGEAVRGAVALEGGAELGDAALGDGGGVAAEHQRLVGLGGGVDDDGAAAGEERGELVAHLLAELVVEVGERLVEEDEVGCP